MSGPVSPVSGPDRGGVRGLVRIALAWGLALVAGTAAAPVRAQDLPDPRLERAFAGTGVTLLIQELDSARAHGLPTEPLIQKALEGKSKGASEERILSAVQALRARLSTAADLLGTDAPEPALTAAAAALYLGVRTEDLQGVVEKTPETSVPMALVVFADLVERGVDPEVANEVMLSLGTAGADPATLAEFRERVEADIRTGVLPGQAARVRSRGVVVSLGRGGGPGGGEAP